MRVSGSSRWNRWQPRQGRDGLPSAAVEDVHEDRSGALWVGTTAGTFRRAPGKNGFDLVDPAPASTLAEDPQGRMWVAHRDQGITRIAPRPESAAEAAVAIPLTGGALLCDRSGHLWVGSGLRAGLTRISIDPRTSRWSADPLSDERGVFDKLAIALKGANDEVRQFFFGNRSSRAEGPWYANGKNVRRIGSLRLVSTWAAAREASAATSARTVNVAGNFGVAWAWLPILWIFSSPLCSGASVRQSSRPVLRSRPSVNSFLSCTAVKKMRSP